MVAIFRRLFEPAKTSHLSRFKWNDKRPKSEQVVGGIRIAAQLIFGFVVLVIAGISTLTVLGFPDRPPRGVLLLSWIAMLGSAAAALWTAHIWAPVILVFFGSEVLRMTAIDRIALTASVWTLFVRATVTDRFPPLPLLSGVAALLAAWCIDHTERKTRKHARKQMHAGPMVPTNPTEH